MIKKKLEEHCFMRDVYTEQEIPNIETASFKNSRNFAERKVGEYEYRDPDENCKELYEMMVKLFFEKAYPNAEITYDSKQLVIFTDADKEVKLTSDYIGPSATSGIYAGLEDAYVWETILKCRTIGGHLIWPRCARGINPSKAASGSKGFGISDRTDIALYELKNYLNNIEAICYNQALKKSFDLPMNQKWFMDEHIFGCNPKGKFESYCDFFMLKGSFVDENYNIIWFADPMRKKEDYESVKSYFDNNIKAIEKRNTIIAKHFI